MSLPTASLRHSYETPPVNVVSCKLLVIRGISHQGKQIGGVHSDVTNSYNGLDVPAWSPGSYWSTWLWPLLDPWIGQMFYGSVFRGVFSLYPSIKEKRHAPFQGLAEVCQLLPTGLCEDSKFMQRVSRWKRELGRPLLNSSYILNAYTCSICKISKFHL